MLILELIGFGDPEIRKVFERMNTIYYCIMVEKVRESEVMSIVEWSQDPWQIYI